MELYHSPNNTNIEAYKIGSDYIIIKFKGNGNPQYYKYTYEVTGREIVDHLKRLAQSGNGGLNSALHRSRGIQYAKKW